MFGKSFLSDDKNDTARLDSNSTFVSTSIAPKHLDHATIRVTVATLNNLESTADKVQFGKYTFSHVRVIGEIVAVDETVSKGTHYMIRDINTEDQTPFLVIQYFGIDAKDTLAFFEETIVHVIGKLQTFEDRLAILAFKVLEVMEPQMGEIFRKEARVVELYFSKNCPELYETGNMPNFIGTILSCEVPPSNNRTKPAVETTPALPTNPVAINNNVASVSNDVNGLAVYGSTQTGIRGSNPQQAKILEFFKSNPVLSDDGHDAETIRAAVGCYADFDDDIRDLAEVGKIYTTIDDNHYNLVE